MDVVFQTGIYELTDLNIILQQQLQFYRAYGITANIEADTILFKSILTTSNGIYFNSELNKVLGFTKTIYPKGIHISEKPVMITTTDKVHLKCDCVDGSIVNGIREQILFSFDSSAPPGYKIMKKPTTILYKKINKTRLDNIRFFLKDSSYNPDDFYFCIFFNETILFIISSNHC